MNKKFDRDFFDWHASPRPGRLGPRLLQYTPDAGDGTPGLQWMFRKMLEVLGQYFVIEGCEYSEDSGGKVIAGWIFFESKIVEVSEQTSVGVLSSLGDGYFIYINDSGTAGNSNVDGTFISNVISSMREHSTTIDVRFKGHANKFVISHDLIVGKTLDVHGAVDFYSALSMNSAKITDLGAPTLANDAVRKTYIDTFALSGDLGGTLSAPTVVDDSHAHNTQYYTKTLLDDGQLDSRYFTETEADTRYFQKTEFLNISAGVGDAGKPIKLDSAGKVDATMVNDADISHNSLSGLNDGDNYEHITQTQKTALHTIYSHPGTVQCNAIISCNGAATASYQSACGVVLKSATQIIWEP